MNKYVKIARFDNWRKQVLVLVGVLFALIAGEGEGVIKAPVEFVENLALTVLALCFVASANYVLNEWLDAKTDKFHPIKKNRTCIVDHMNPWLIVCEYLFFALAGLGLALLADTHILVCASVFLGLGFLFNVKPFRLKDVFLADIIAEAANNMERFTAGWFVVTTALYPRASLVLACWFSFAAILSRKRYKEIKIFETPEAAGKYRKSYRLYTPRGLKILWCVFGTLAVVSVVVFAASLGRI